MVKKKHEKIEDIDTKENIEEFSVTKSEDVVTPTDKQFTIFYNMNGSPQLFFAHGDEYTLSAIPIKSETTGEVFSFPVVYIMNNDDDSVDIIPFNSVGNLRYNFGFKEEMKEYKKQFEKAKKNISKKIDVNYG